MVIAPELLKGRFFFGRNSHGSKMSSIYENPLFLERGSDIDVHRIFKKAKIIIKMRGSILSNQLIKYQY